jgi:hypothetical protein
MTANRVHPVLRLVVDNVIERSLEQGIPRACDRRESTLGSPKRRTSLHDPQIHRQRPIGRSASQQ